MYFLLFFKLTFKIIIIIIIIIIILKIFNYKVVAPIERIKIMFQVTNETFSLKKIPLAIRHIYTTQGKLDWNPYNNNNNNNNNNFNFFLTFFNFFLIELYRIYLITFILTFCYMYKVYSDYGKVTA
jgi:hypothetical protein